MSATLRYDVGLQMVDAVGKLDNRIWTLLGAKQASRWGGIGRSRKLCLTFAIKLPQQVDLAVRLLSLLVSVCKVRGGTIQMSARTLYDKLTKSLGMPKDLWETFPPMEQAFLKKCWEEPEDLANWMTYADWLQENDNWRGELIASWLHPKKALKCKYGVPIFVLEKEAGR